MPCSASRVVPGAHRVVGPGTHRGSGPREVHTTPSNDRRPLLPPSPARWSCRLAWPSPHLRWVILAIEIWRATTSSHQHSRGGLRTGGGGSSVHEVGGAQDRTSNGVTEETTRISRDGESTAGNSHSPFP
jgi:hypothetical protein